MMPTYQPSVFVEPLGYQPVEFLDIPRMHDPTESDLIDVACHVERTSRSRD
jgi:hypothetical protein